MEDTFVKHYVDINKNIKRYYSVNLFITEHIFTTSFGYESTVSLTLGSVYGDQKTNGRSLVFQSYYEFLNL